MEAIHRSGVAQVAMICDPVAEMVAQAADSVDGAAIVASFDEDASTLAFEAGRRTWGAAPGPFSVLISGVPRG